MYGKIYSYCLFERLVVRASKERIVHVCNENKRILMHYDANREKMVRTLHSSFTKR